MPDLGEELDAEIEKLKQKEEELKKKIAERKKSAVTKRGRCWSLLHEFKKQYQNFIDEGRPEKSIKAFLKDKHNECFGDFPELGTPIEIVKLRIQYHLQYEGFKAEEEEGKLSSDFMQNYTQAMKMGKTLEGFTQSIRATLGVVLYHKQKDGRAEREEARRQKIKDNIEKRKRRVEKLEQRLES